MEGPEREDLWDVDFQLLVFDRDDEHVIERRQGKQQEERQRQPQRERAVNVVAERLALRGGVSSAVATRPPTLPKGFRFRSRSSCRSGCPRQSSSARVVARVPQLRHHQNTPGTAACTATPRRPGPADRPASRSGTRVCANRCVVSVGPPRVSTCTIWKSENVWIIENSSTIVRTGISSGMVTAEVATRHWRRRSMPPRTDPEGSSAARPAARWRRRACRARC